MLYELRMYQAAPGRMEDVAARMRDHMPPLFAKHGFPRPLGQWRALAGARLPLYVWLLAWTGSQARAAAFASLYADEAWAAVRQRTGGSRPPILNYEVLLMHAAPAWEAARSPAGAASDPVGGLHELRICELYPGRLPQVNRALAEVDLPALSRRGGSTLGVFDIQSGWKLQAFAHFLAWPDFETRRGALEAYERDPTVLARREAELAEINTHQIVRHDSWLLEPAGYGLPNPGFADG
jgi:hypothetical protein